MLEITEAFITSAAPDSSSVSNGRSLAQKGSFTKLAKDEAETLLFGECAGSGKTPYRVSVDFINPENPTYRCSCPSRKFPCKHAIGLMFAFVQKKPFTTETVPDDVAEKREKLQKKEEKKADSVADGSAAKPAKPKKVNKAALAKKIETQNAGLELAEKLLSSIIRDGFGTLTPKAVAEMEKQAKQLGDHYLPGVQSRLREFLAVFDGEMTEEGYSEAFDLAVRLSALIRRGKDYLVKKAEDPAMKDTDSEIEALLGHAWQLTELEEAGRCEKDAELMQLSFNCFENNPAKTYEEVGVWLDLADGGVYRTMNYRPFKAAKHIAQDDSVFGVLTTSALYKYPGLANPRVRWEGFKLRDAAPADYGRLVAHARDDLAATLKQIKDVMKNPLADLNPFALIRYAKIGMVGVDVVLEDPSGQRIVLVNAGEQDWPDTLPVLDALGKTVNDYTAALLRFKYRPDQRDLVAAPLALVSAAGIVRLAF